MNQIQKEYRDSLTLADPEDIGIYTNGFDQETTSEGSSSVHNIGIEPGCDADLAYAMDIQAQHMITLLEPQQLLLDVSSAPEVEQTARPFLKWVGGKTQLLKHIDANLPPAISSGLLIYAEPFLGGGSVFFHVAQKYAAKRFIISDNNRDLIWAYKAVQKYVHPLTSLLQELQSSFWVLSTEDRSKMYYETRESFNNERHELTENSEFRIRRTAQMIFLNKTCFNGLYRVNSAGGFNVAFGKYDRPPICDQANLLSCSRVLQRAEIIFCDFEEIRGMMNSGTFIYLDPPYRPISETSNFTSYSSTTFVGGDQERLAKFCLDLHKKGCHLMISNSDPKNLNPDDAYFETTYPDFKIATLSANRMVNCKADRRGKISELLITNY